MDYIKGDAIVLYIWDDTVYRPVACLTSNSLSQTRGVIETQTKCNPGLTEKAAGAMSYDISAEGNYIDTTSAGAEVTKASHDFLFGIMNAGTSVTWKMDTGLSDEPNYFGTAILSDLEMTAPTGDELTTFSCGLAGSGAIVTTDPEAP